MSIQNIVDAVYASISTATGAGGVNASDALAGRVYGIEGRENAAFPHMVMSVPSVTTDRAFGGVISYDINMQFDIWFDKSLGSDSAMDIEAKLFSLLEGQSLSATGFDRALCTFNSRCNQIVDEDGLRISDELRIRATDF